MGGKVRVRKVRSDKKIEVKPTITLDLNDCIDRISYITMQPIQDVGAYICEQGLKSESVIEKMVPYFKRDFWKSEHTLIRGDLDAKKLILNPEQQETTRISIRFKQTTHQRIHDLAYALYTTPSGAVSFLLKTAVCESDILQRYLAEYVEKRLDPNRAEQLKQIIRFINENNDSNEELTFSMVLSYLMDRTTKGARDLKQVLVQWIDETTITYRK